MDDAKQAEGAARVRRLLVEPLLRRGLARPGGLTKAAFAEMCDDLCARLAYMSERGLAALEEQAAGAPSGKDKDRFPIANKILDWAGDIEPPPDDASPLMRAVFAHDVGRGALLGGWAPELLGHLRKNRRWPNAWVAHQLRKDAEGPISQMRDIERALSRGDAVSPEARRWREARQAVEAKCRALAEAAT